MHVFDSEVEIRLFGLTAPGDALRFAQDSAAFLSAHACGAEKRAPSAPYADGAYRRDHRSELIIMRTL